MFDKNLSVTSHLCNQSIDHDDEDEHEHHAPYKLMFLCSVLFVGCLFKTMLAPLRVPYTGVILFLGFIGGVLFNIFSKDDTFLTITTSSPDLLVAIFLPTLIFESAYRTEYHAFMKSLSSILSISIVGYFTGVFSIALIDRYLFFGQQWTFLQGLILGVIVSATRPITLMRQADYGKTKRLNIILEGEAVINNSLAIVLFNSLKRFVVGQQTWNLLEFLRTTAIALVGGIGLGTLTGFLEIISLPYFYDDPISEVTITIAIPYMLYWLCEQVHCSGVVAIVVLGLLLANHKTAISSEATIFMEKFWDMLTLIVNTIIYLLAALTMAELVKLNQQTSFQGTTVLLEVGLAIINYLNCYFVRIVTIIGLTSSAKLCPASHLSWKECLLVTWGGLKGAICLILAVTLAGEFELSSESLNRRHHHRSKFKYQILIHTTIIVFLSSCINSTYSFLLKILDFTTISPTKYHYMAQCVESLRALVHEKVQLLKKNKYLANADWVFIESNFRIENPHAPNVSSHNQTQHSDEHGRRAMEPELSETEYEEAPIRILNIQKTSFWRQYRDYEISTQAVRILSSLCDFAIDRKRQSISIDQLKYYYRPRAFDFVWKYLQERSVLLMSFKGMLVRRIHYWLADDWRKYQKVPEGKWRAICFHLLDHRSYHWFIACIILLNVTLAIIRAVVSIPHRFNLTFTVLQTVCVAVYIVELVMKIYTFGIRTYFRTWIDHRIEFFLTLLALGERVFEYNALIHSISISRRTRSLVQILLVVQLLRFSRRIASVTAHLNTLLERKATHYVTLSLELCKAYITSEDDVLSKLRRIVEHDRIREQLDKDSIRRRNEVIDELTFIQREHPNVAASVQTSAAIQKLLNYSKNMIHHMASKGLLGENEAHRITENINQRLHTDLVTSALFFPTPLNFLHVFPWLHDPDILEYVLSRLHVQLFSLNEYIYQVNHDAQALYFITAGYVETIRSTTEYHDALSIEKFHEEKRGTSHSFDPTSNDQHGTSVSVDTVHQSRSVNDQSIDMLDRDSLLHEDLSQWSEDESEAKYRLVNEKKHSLGFTESILSHLNIDNSIVDFFPTKASAVPARLLHAPGDILGHIDLLNGQRYTETCKCITNTLVWYLPSNDLIDLVERFSHLRTLEKLWHYTALQLAEVVLYEYLNTLPHVATEQERIHIYGHLKRAFLIPESYLIEHEIIYSSHELILIQGQLQNTVSSVVYTAPCFIQIECGQCGLKPLNVVETKILVLRSPHHHPVHIDEFTLAKDLPDLFTHVLYDDKLGIFLPRISSKHKYKIPVSTSDESASQVIKKTLLGRFLESLPRFQRRIVNSKTSL